MGAFDAVAPLISLLAGLSQGKAQANNEAYTRQQQAIQNTAQDKRLEVARMEEARRAGADYIAQAQHQEEISNEAEYRKNQLELEKQRMDIEDKYQKDMLKAQTVNDRARIENDRLHALIDLQSKQAELEKTRLEARKSAIEADPNYRVINAIQDQISKINTDQSGLYHDPRKKAVAIQDIYDSAFKLYGNNPALSQDTINTIKMNISPTLRAALGGGVPDAGAPLPTVIPHIPGPPVPAYLIHNPGTGGPIDLNALINLPPLPSLVPNTPISPLSTQGIKTVSQ